MEIINRSAILVKPAQPFLDWLHQVDPTSAHLRLDDLRLEPTIYLLPECESKEEAIECLREVCTEMFEEQLDGWYRVPSAWPAERDLNLNGHLKTGHTWTVQNRPTDSARNKHH
jgi:hypothetical protein